MTMNASNLIKELRETKSYISLSKGIWLHHYNSLEEEQKQWEETDDSKHIDFSSNEFWLVTDNGITESIDENDLQSWLDDYSEK